MILIFVVNVVMIVNINVRYKRDYSDCTDVYAAAAAAADGAGGNKRGLL